MFLENKYTDLYFRLTNRAKKENRIKFEGQYYEEHHIIPKCLGGKDDRTNRVLLTAKEHFLCHFLLVKMTQGNQKAKMSYAFKCMCIQKNEQQQLRYVNGRLFNLLKRNFKHSEETKAKLKISRKRQIFTPQTRIKMGLASRGRVKSLEVRKVLSEKRKRQPHPRLGTKKSPQEIERLRASIRQHWILRKLKRGDSNA